MSIIILDKEKKRSNKIMKKFTIVETLIHEIEAETVDEAVDMMTDSTICDSYINEITEDEI